MEENGKYQNYLLRTKGIEWFKAKRNVKQEGEVGAE